MLGRTVWLIWLFALTGSSAAQATPHALPLTNAVATLNVSCVQTGSPVETASSIKDLTSLACDRAAVFTGTGGSVVSSLQLADARTELITLPVGNRKVPRPQADVQSLTRVTLSDHNENVGVHTTLAGANIIGTMRLNPLAPNPGQILMVPLHVMTRGSTQLTSSLGGSFAFARSTLFGPGVAIDDTANNGSSYNFDRSVSVEADEIYSHEVTAGCSTIASVALFENSCQAVADPTFAFDRAAFDAAMGANTFSLADFFEIELSANILAAVPVPVPGTSALRALGLWSLHRWPGRTLRGRLPSA